MTIGKYTVECRSYHTEQTPEAQSNIETFLFNKLSEQGLSKDSVLIIDNQIVKVLGVIVTDYNNTILIQYTSINAD